MGRLCIQRSFNETNTMLPGSSSVIDRLQQTNRGYADRSGI